LRLTRDGTWRPEKAERYLEVLSVEDFPLVKL